MVTFHTGLNRSDHPHRDSIIEMSLAFYGRRKTPLQEKRERDKAKTIDAINAACEAKLKWREECRQQRDIINDRLPFFDKLSIRNVGKVVSSYYEIPFPVLLSPQRRASVVFARHVTFFLCRELPITWDGSAKSLPEIGRNLGNKDHSSVIHGIRRIKLLIDGGDKRLIADLALLSKHCLSIAVAAKPTVREQFEAAAE